MASVSAGGAIEFRPSEIINFLQEHGVGGATEDDLKKPKSEDPLLHNLYRWFVMAITKCGDKSIDQPPFDPNETQPLDPDVYIVGQQKMMLIAAVDTLFQEVSPDVDFRFTAMDLTHPKSRKTVRNLSLLMAFLQTIEHRQDTVAAIQEKYNEKEEKKRAILANMDDLKNEINKLRAEKAKSQPKVQALLEERNALKAQAETYLKKIEEVKNRNEQHESRLRSEFAAMEVLKNEKAQLDAENAALEEQIMTSPEKMESAMGSSREEQIGMEKEIRDLNENLARMKDRKKELDTVGMALDSLMEDLKTCEEDKETFDKLLVEKTKILEKIETQKLRLEDGKLTVAEKRGILEAKEEQLDKLKRTHRAKMGEMEKEVEKITQRLKVVEMNREEAEVVAVDLDEKCALLKEKVLQQREEYKEHREKLEAKYKELLVRLDRTNANAFAYYDRLYKMLGLEGDGKESPPEDPKGSGGSDESDTE